MKKGSSSVVPIHNIFSRGVQDTTSLFRLSCQINLFMLAYVISKMSKTSLGRITDFIFLRPASVLDLRSL